MTIKNIVRATLGAIVVGVGGYLIFFHHPSTYQFVTVERGPLIESVALTGNTTPARSVSLAFQNTGMIAHVYANLGDQVTRGEVIAELSTASLAAALEQAQATVDAAQAQLDNLKAGSQPADLAVSQATLNKATQDLANMYASISDASSDSFAKANDAVRTQLNQFFTNGDTSNAQLTYSTANFQAQNDAQAERVSVAVALTAWQNQLATGPQSPAALQAFSQQEITYLAAVQQLLNTVSTTLGNAPGLSAATLAAYKANVSLAMSEVNAAIKNLNTISQNIASQQETVAQAQAQLALKQAGSTPETIAAQQAQVAQAQASVALAEANVQNAKIVAPISGVLTQQDAKLGQLASPGIPLISIIGNGGFEVDAGVSETDVGKILVGDTVSMTLDAFPGKTFSGAVFYIAPAGTNTQGVISYQIKISFDTPDPRLKSGLTANITIETSHKDSVLIVPQYAILQNDQGTFVEVLKNKVVTQIPVTLGIQDQNGNVEVISGVSEGEQVINIGRKAQ